MSASVTTSGELTVAGTIARLAREASLEIGVHDVKELEAGRAFLSPGHKVSITFLPKQEWNATIAVSRAVREVGLEPVPHIPVRVLASEQQLDEVMAGLVSDARVQEVLLISGDYPRATGPFARVEDVLHTGVLEKHGVRRVAFAGHPEGHPQVAREEIRRAQLEKARRAEALGLTTTFITQFFFEAEPFLQWAAEMRGAGVHARLIAGLAGPARLSTLFKLAVRCGAGASIRALGAKPAAFTKLLGEHGPESIIRTLADAQNTGDSDFAGIHLFCFGGYLRTCQWLHRIANGQFSLDDSGGFAVDRD